MARLSIEITDEQHRAIKAFAAMRDMAMKDFVLHRSFHEKPKGKSSQETAAHKGYGAGHPDCALCRKYSKNGRYNAKTERAIADTLAGRNLKRFNTAEELFAELRK